MWKLVASAWLAVITWLPETLVVATSWFDGPADESSRGAWIEDLKRQRELVLQGLGFAGGAFGVRSVLWTQTSYFQPQVHPYDSYLYDRGVHKYTVDRYLDDLEERYGGIDSVLLWPTFPLLGLDDRNQFDMFRSLPGGLPALRDAIAQFHARGVRVLWAYNPWDLGTRLEGKPHFDVLVEMLKETGGDGANGDTMYSFNRSFWEASLKAEHAVAGEPEQEGTDDSFNYSTIGWSETIPYSEVPAVDRFKWFDGRWMAHVCDRWHPHKGRDPLQAAFFNGIGLETWENVWSCWLGLTEGDAEAVRRGGAMLRYFGRRGLLTSQSWEPHVPTLQEGVYASAFPSAGGDEVVWLLINTAGKDLSGELIAVSVPSGTSLYNCYSGVPARAQRHIDGAVTVSLTIEAYGLGCIFATRASSVTGSFAVFLASMRKMTALPLRSFDYTVRMLPMRLLPVDSTPAYQAPPAGMVVVAGGPYQFVSEGQEFFWLQSKGVPSGCGLQFPWEERPATRHNTSMFIPRFYMDKFPVTCSEYSEYLTATQYSPRDPTRWLDRWGGSRTPPIGWEKKPVTHVSLDEARAYCAWKGARLPHAWEWQYAAQGSDGRRYPWGSSGWKAPAVLRSNIYAGPSDVDAHLDGCSPFEVCDLVGNTWQYTDQFEDARTRFVMLKGGSNYIPSTGLGKWYYRHAHQVTQYNRLPLMDDSFDRAATVGFRCAADAELSLSAAHASDAWLV